MKRSSTAVPKSSPAPASAPRPSRAWAAIAVASLLANAVLGWMLWSGRPAPTAPVPAGTVGAPSAAKPTGELAPYAALGSFMAENNRISDLQWTEAQFGAFVNGVRATYEGRGYPLDEDARKLRDEISTKVQKLLAVDRPDPVQDYFRMLREKENVLQTASGLHYRITDEGPGAAPTADSTVMISYAAKLPSGESLPSLSRNRVRTTLNDLLPGLREGVQLLRVGGKGLVYVPADLSFGSGDWPQEVPRGVPIVFFVELHEVQ